MKLAFTAYIYPKGGGREGRQEILGTSSLVLKLGFTAYV